MAAWEGIACGTLNSFIRRRQLAEADPGAVNAGGEFGQVVEKKAADRVGDEPVTQAAVNAPEDGHT